MARLEEKAFVDIGVRRSRDQGDHLKVAAVARPDRHICLDGDCVVCLSRIRAVLVMQAVPARKVTAANLTVRRIAPVSGESTQRFWN
jgi:hypothetical protein